MNSDGVTISVATKPSNSSSDLKTVTGTAKSTNDETNEKIKTELNGLAGIQWVERAALFVLELDRPTRDRPLNAKTIYQRLKSLEFNIPVAENTFVQYLSQLAMRAESRITSPGQGRGSGYYLSDTTRQIAEMATAVVEEPAKERSKEKYLYPLLRNWLASQGYRADDTSTVRNLGKWGNPDITGLRVSDHLGRIEIEVATIEAKAGIETWEMEFFQAVSQRRFANRAYFAFPLPEESSEKLPEDLRYYSDLFEVGVLVVDLPDDVYFRLVRGELTAADKELLNDPDSISIREVFSAPRHPVAIEYQRRFCEALAINDLTELLVWGTEQQ